MMARFIIASLLFVCGAGICRAQTPSSIFIHLAKGEGIEATLVDLEQKQSFETPGLLIWVDAAGQERVDFVKPGEMSSQEGDSGSPLEFDFANSRGAGVQSGSALAYVGLTKQLDQLRSSEIARDPEVHFLTPPRGGRILNPKLTIRRIARSEGEKYPEATAILSLKGGKSIRISFAKSQTEIGWSEIVKLGGVDANGLPPGNHSLRMTGATGLTRFAVEDQEIRAYVMKPIDALARLVPSRSPLLAQFAAEHLLNSMEERPAYFADALDFIDDVPAKSISPHLKRLGEQIRTWLAKPEQTRRDAAVVAAPGEATGVAPIDEARQLIASAQWAKAKLVLDKFATSATTPRQLGLLSLYRAVIAAEAGPIREREARESFHKALDELGNSIDGVRAGNNFGDYLQRQSQDRLYNHAFQLAAGSAHPFVTALDDWMLAERQYEAAHALALKLERQQEADAIRVNQGRLYALLGDIIGTVDTQEKFSAGRKAAATKARILAEEAARAGSEPLTRAMAFELLASLAYRAGDKAGSRAFTEKTRRAFMEAGHLAGVENTFRLLGLLADTPQKALQYLQTAHLLSESLRTRLPFDKVGATRAGYFARKAFTVEKIIELLIQLDRDEEALQYVELIRARSFQDVLAHARAGRSPLQPDVSESFAHWPDDTVALEYYLGSEAGWLFVVDRQGNVAAHQLQDTDGKTIRSRDLIARVRTFLSDVDVYPRVTASRLYEHGFDHSWQDTLHDFFRILMPEPARKATKAARRVVVVPHHILHYFPFAALVSEPDRSKLEKYQMAKPRFLVDEPFRLVSSPSLTFWSLLQSEPVPELNAVNAVGIAEFASAPPLPGVTKEIEELRKIFGKQVKTILPGDQADESAILELLRRRGLLVIATHGWNNPDQPLESMLLCQSGPDSDGNLRAREIYDAEVGADLVVLNACYSGLADRSPLPGDDLFGLQRALLSSGARTVVSGLWRVDDTTGSQLMNNTLRFLKKGMPISEALAQSQRSFLKERRASTEPDPWIHPYYWAVYSLVGDDRVRFAP